MNKPSALLLSQKKTKIMPSSSEEHMTSAESSSSSPDDSETCEATYKEGERVSEKVQSGSVESDSCVSDEENSCESEDEENAECALVENVEANDTLVEASGNDEAEDQQEAEEEDAGLGLTPRITTPGTHRKGTPMQSRTGWETDEGAESAAAAFDAQLILGPPAFSPKSRLRWLEMACSPRSPVASLQRETSGGAFRSCTAHPCSPMGDAGLPWDMVLGQD